MPRTEVVFYRDDDGSVPVLEWLDGLALKARIKILARFERLRELGHELRRPEADLLRDGIYELRISLNRIQYRLLYAFHTEAEGRAGVAFEPEGKGSGRKGSSKRGRSEEPHVRRTIAVVAHGITKEGKVPDQEIDRALGRMRKFAADPGRHTHAEG